MAWLLLSYLPSGHLLELWEARWTLNSQVEIKAGGALNLSAAKELTSSQLTAVFVCSGTNTSQSPFEIQHQTTVSNWDDDYEAGPSVEYYEILGLGGKVNDEII